MNNSLLKWSLIIVMTTLLFSCLNKNSKEIHEKNRDNDREFSNYYGSWKLVEKGTVIGDVLINIYNDGEFCYIDSGRDSIFGKWSCDDSIIVLSNDSLNHSGINGFNLFVYDCEDPLEYLNINNEYRIKNKSAYEYFVFFDHERFRFSNDSLIYLHREDFVCKDSIVFVKLTSTKRND